MAAIKFSEKIHIAGKQEMIFDYSQDYNNRLKWDTFLRKAIILHGVSAAAKGVKTYCVAKNGLGMETEYISFHRPKVAAVKMTAGPFLFKTFQASWTFKPGEHNMTEVKFLYSFELRFPFNLFTYFIKRSLRSNVRQRLQDLKACVEDIAGKL